MPPKPPKGTNWKPLDIFEEGRNIRSALPERKIWDYIVRTLPNWDKLADTQHIGVWSSVTTAFVLLEKARRDYKGHPRVATVRANLLRLQTALDEATAAFAELDVRSADYLKRVAGARASGPADYNSTPSNESLLGRSAFDRGHHRIQLLRKALANACQWTTDARAKVPRQDTRIPEPGLDGFVGDVAHVWELYAGKRFTASRNRGGAPDFAYGLLRVAGYKIELATVVKAAQRVVGTLKADRIIVAPEDRWLPLAELARRGSRPRTGKRSATG